MPIVILQAGFCSLPFILSLSLHAHNIANTRERKGSKDRPTAVTGFREQTLTTGRLKCPPANYFKII
jgi:hypothetical protein